MSRRSFLMSEQIGEYADRNWIDEPEILRELREETARTMKDPDMQISADLGQFLTVLLKSIQAKRTIEVGVFTGYSSTVTALAMADEGRVIACDVSEEFTSVARKFWAKAGVAHKIDLRLRPALETLDDLIQEGWESGFDFAFIDADKGGYLDYFDRCVQLVRSGGMIAVDNVLWAGRVADSSNQEESTNYIREFNSRVHQDKRVTACLVPLGDGLTLAVKH